MRSGAKKTINPCIAKGRYGGKRGGGDRSIKVDHRYLKPTGCECTKPWILFGAEDNEPKSCRFYYDFENNRLMRGDAPSKNNRTQDADTLISVTPCNEAFLHPTSKGTELHKSQNQTKFRGCYPMEEKLLAEGLIRHEPFDNLNADFDESYVDDPDEVLAVDHLLTTEKERSNYHIKSHINHYKNQEAHRLAQKPQSQKSSPWEIGIYLQEKLNELEDYSYLLTNKQKQAITYLYLDNEMGLSTKDVAKKLKISKDSLKDRIKGALVRILKVNPHFKFPERRKSSEDAKNWELQDSEFDGFYRKSNAKPNPVSMLDPESLEPIGSQIKPENFKKQKSSSKKRKKSVDQATVKKWLDEEFSMKNKF